MSKKLMTGLLALLALAAMALPAAASASPEIGETSGGVFTRLATGVAIRATNVGTTLMTDANTNVLVSCTTAQMDGTLNKNSGTEIEGTINTASFSGTGTSGACTGFFGSNATITTAAAGTNGTPYCLKAGGKLSADAFQLRGNSCANAARSITFILDTSFGTCKYERSSANPVNGTFVTDTSGQQATATIFEQEFPAEAGNPFGCPSAGYLDMTFSLETTNGTALYIK
jgi:hypothetical protein